MKKLLPFLFSVTLLAGCGRTMPTGYQGPTYVPQNNQFRQIPVQRYQSQGLLRRFNLRAPGDLLEVPGFQTGDDLELDGPLWFNGTGKVHHLEGQKFSVEINVAGNHFLINASRKSENKVDLVVTNKKDGVVENAVADYKRVGNRSDFFIGEGQDIERFIIDGKSRGRFDLHIQQPSRTVKFKVTKG